MDQLSTVTKALQVLQAFSYEHPVMGVSELGRKLAMGKSSVHRVLSTCLLYTSPSPRDRTRSRMPSSA